MYQVKSLISIKLLKLLRAYKKLNSILNTICIHSVVTGVM